MICSRCGRDRPRYKTSPPALCKSCYNLNWNHQHPDLVRAQVGRRLKENLRAATRRYQFRRAASDIDFRLRRALRVRLHDVLKGQHRTGSAVRDLGCTWDDLKRHLESKFQIGMTWDNWGHGGWHIDHIKPLTSFDLSDPVQFKEAVNYRNLQPLWATDNIRKSNKLP